MAEFQIKDKTYRSGRLDTFKAFHVTRRLAPLVAAMGSGLDSMRGDWLGIARAIADGIATMPDAEAEYVLHAALGVVQRQQGQAWAPVWNVQGGLMFADIGLAEMLQIAGYVLQENLADFFAALPGFGPVAAQPDSSQLA